MRDQRLRELFKPLHEEATTLAPKVFAGAALPEHPCAYFIRDAYFDPRKKQQPPPGWPKTWREHWHLPCPFLGDPGANPSIAFVGVNPNIDHREPGPTIETSLDDWLASLKTSFDSCGRFHPAIDPVPLYENYYQPALRSALGVKAVLGRHALVAEIIPYKSHSPTGNNGRRDLNRAIKHPTCLPLTLRFLSELKIKIIVTVGNEPTHELGGYFVTRLKSSKITEVHAQTFHAKDGLSIIPARHNASWPTRQQVEALRDALKRCAAHHGIVAM
jgi:hypothetical protein